MYGVYINDGELTSKKEFIGRKRYKENSFVSNSLNNIQKIKHLKKKTGNLNGILTDYNPNSNQLIPRKITFKLSHTLFGEGGEELHLAKKLSQSDLVQNLSEKSFLLDNKEFFSDKLIDNLMGWKFPAPIGKGLRNLGNTCFLNSVLQCILYTPPLKNYIILYNHKKLCTLKGVCFLCEYSKLVEICMSNSGGGVETPINFIQNLKNISKHLKVGRQEDAHEFLIYLLDSMERSSKKFMEQNSHKFIVENNLNTDNLVQKIYGGITKSSVICGKCKKSSDTFEQFLDAGLEISNADNIEKCFYQFCKSEYLTGDNKYMCSFCKQRNDSVKKITYKKLHLKRFDNFRKKIKKHISYSEHLDLTSLVSNSNEKHKYKLISILIHEGYSTNSGHYFCYVKNSNDMWYCMNDSMVSQVSLSLVLKQNPYLLFYEKEMPKAEFLLPLPLIHKVSAANTINTKIADKINAINASSGTNGNVNGNVNGKENINGKLKEKEFNESIQKGIHSVDKNEKLKKDDSKGLLKEVSDEMSLTRSNSINFLLKSNELPPIFSKKLKQLLALKHKTSRLNRLKNSVSTMKNEIENKTNNEIECVLNGHANNENNTIPASEAHNHISFNLLKGSTMKCSNSNTFLDELIKKDSNISVISNSNNNTNTNINTNQNNETKTNNNITKDNYNNNNNTEMSTSKKSKKKKKLQAKKEREESKEETLNTISNANTPTKIVPTKKITKNKTKNKKLEAALNVNKTKIDNFYGNSNIEIWDDDSDDEGNIQISDLIKKQLKFVHTNSMMEKPIIPSKDEYDLEYDKGKQKKIKKKVNRFNRENKFQEHQDYKEYNN